MDYWRSVPRKYIVFVTVVSAALILLGVGIASKSSVGKLSVKGQKFSVELAATKAEQQQGLSGRDGIGTNNVMLFVFDQEAQRCFWMKDMKFNIDMVWIDGEERVVAIESDVSPKTYPSNFCHDNAQYVAEFKAGVAKQLNLKPGDQISL